MRLDLSWSFGLAGAMNTANAIGYLLGSLVAAPITRRFGLCTAFRGALALTTVSIAASATTASAFALLGLRLSAGFTAAIAFVIGASMVTHLSTRSGISSQLSLGIYFAGVGTGIAISGLIIPPIDAVLVGGLAWRTGWIALAVAAALVLPAAWWAAGAVEARSAIETAPFDPRSLWVLLVSYTLFGAGYIGYMTFIVAYLRERDGLQNNLIGGFWITLGVAGMVGPLAWSRVISRSSSKAIIAILVATTAVGAVLPLLGTHPVIGFLSAILFGSSFLAAITAITDAPRRMLPPAQWTASIAGLTSGFAVGQCIGPIATGIASDSSGGLGLGLAVSAAILAASATFALAQPRRTAFADP